MSRDAPQLTPHLRPVVATVLILSACHRGGLVASKPSSNAHPTKGAVAAASTPSSPMPLAHYEVEHGDYNFISVTPSALDLALQALVRRFARENRDERATLVAAMSADDEDTLLQFAERCAVLALREAKASWCEDGLFALAMLDETRVDPLDVGRPTGLLSYAMTTTGADRDALVGHALSLARPGMRSTVESARIPRSLSSCSYVQVRTDDGGLGLIKKNSAHYDPTLDLTKLALHLAGWLDRGRYAAETSVAEALPPIWFAKEHREEAKGVLARARAGIAAEGKLRKKQSPTAESQLFRAWVLETPDEATAKLLDGYVGAGSPVSQRFTKGIVRGRLFALVVAGSWHQGVAPFETPESVAGLAEEMAPFLDAALHD